MVDKDSLVLFLCVQPHTVIVCQMASCPMCDQGTFDLLIAVNFKVEAVKFICDPAYFLLFDA